MCHKVTKKLSKSFQKKSQKLSKSCHKVAKKLSKSCQKVLKKFSKRCPAQELFWPNIGKTIGQTVKTKTRKLGNSENLREWYEEEEWTKNGTV
jgi:hypothetical protein